MPIYDMECPNGNIFEAIANVEDETIPCPECGQQSKRIISVSGVHCANEDAAWIRSVVDVVDKKSTNPQTLEFIQNPTRTNLRRHLESTGLRHAERGERFGALAPPFNAQRHAEKLFRHRQKKNAIEVRA